MKKKRRLRKGVYDFIIYMCLFGAIICLLIGSNSYFKNLDNENVYDVVKQVFLNSPDNTKEETPIEEPKGTIVNDEYDKISVIINYFESIKDRIITNDDLISYETILTWNTYEIRNLRYIKEIAENYYEYTADIYLNKEALVPANKNEELSTEEYNVMSLKIYMYEKDKSFYIKNIDSY